MKINQITDLDQEGLDALAEIMDSDLRESVHRFFPDDGSPQEFLDRYIELDPAFGEMPAW